MKNRIVWVATALTLTAFVAALQASIERARSIDLMVEAATHFINALDDDAKKAALFDFDDELRIDWHYIPKAERKGFRIADMNAEQRHLAHVLVSAGQSRTGFAKAATIMSEEYLVLEQELANGQNPRMSRLRNSDYYYFSIFGTPSAEGTWGWSVEGHHVSLNFTIVNGKYAATTPAMFGSEPHLVIEGPRKGLSVLAAEENAARALLASLDSGQKKKTIIADKAPRDILTAAAKRVEVGSVPSEGLGRAEMNAEQKALLQSLIDVYIGNLPDDLAAHRIDIVAEAGDDIRFAWMGSTTRGIGNPHYYRVHGKTFLIEYDNIQDDANHSHSVWRDYENDFGRDLLAEHYRSSHSN